MSPGQGRASLRVPGEAETPELRAVSQIEDEYWRKLHGGGQEAERSV